MIRIEKFSKTIGGNVVLSDINLSLKTGKIYGLSGENGCGKTMLMRAICGLIRGDSGTIIVNGKSIGKDTDFPDDIGVLIENPSFVPNLNAFDNLNLLSMIRGKANKGKISFYLNAVSLDPTSRKKYRRFSLGMKQKLGIAAAFFEEPSIVILDEPFNALDEKTVEKVNDLIIQAKERGALVIVSCHNKELLEHVCDDIFSMRDGKIEE